jgi:hypothetical protein
MPGHVSFDNHSLSDHVHGPFEAQNFEWVFARDSFPFCDSAGVLQQEHHVQVIYADVRCNQYRMAGLKSAYLQTKWRAADHRNNATAVYDEYASPNLHDLLRPRDALAQKLQRGTNYEGW